MKKFKYKFDSILKVKENFKKQAMKEVAKVGKAIEERQIQKKEFIRELTNCKSDFKKTSMKASELQFSESHFFFLTKKIELVDRDIEKLNMLLKMRQRELLEKTQESKIFHRLKESKLLNYKREANKEELKMLDELAIQKMSRG